MKKKKVAVKAKTTIDIGDGLFWLAWAAVMVAVMFAPGGS